jgi:hypothetical protein
MTRKERRAMRRLTRSVRRQSQAMACGDEEADRG